MLFIIDKLKWDTTKMEIVSKKIQYTFTTRSKLLNLDYVYDAVDPTIWKSKKGRYLLTYKGEASDILYSAKVLTENEVKDLLISYDVEKYEEMFGEIEEA